MASVQPPNPLPPDQNVGPILLGISGTCLALVIITTSVRIWVRSALRSSGWDDYTIIIVTLLGIARFGVQVGQVSIGNGRHRWFIEPEDYVQNNKLGWVAQILLFASICLLKISILLLLLRIKDSRRVRYAAWGIMAGLVVTNFGCIIILLSECRPVSAYWTGVGECWNPRIRIYYIYATIGMYFWNASDPGRDWLTKPASILHSHRFDMFSPTSPCDMEHQPSIEDKDLSLGFDELGTSVSWPIDRLPHHNLVTNVQ